MVPPTVIAMHDDEPDVLNLAGTAWLDAEYNALARSQGWPAPGRFTSCLNTGVVMFSQAHAAMWTSPTRPYPPFHTAEQDLVNLNLRRLALPLVKLPSTLNYQWWAHPMMEGPAHVWHFAKTLDMPAEERLRRMRTHARLLS
jgi:hypothetical protein